MVAVVSRDTPSTGASPKLTGIKGTCTRYRCGFPGCNKRYASTDGASSLFENQEKTLGFMLAAANIRLADFYRLNFTKAELAAVSQQRRRRKRS